MTQTMIGTCERRKKKSVLVADIHSSSFLEARENSTQGSFAHLNAMVNFMLKNIVQRE